MFGFALPQEIAHIPELQELSPEEYTNRQDASNLRMKGPRQSASDHST
jgi:hypothetical protein